MCQKTCRSKEELIKHMSLHFVQKTFQCTKCDSPFSSIDSLVNHVSATHTNLENTQTDLNKCEGTCDKLKSVEAKLDEYENNYERLKSIYKESIDEQSKLKDSYEEKLAKANEKLSEYVAEITALKEKNEVLYKLGKIYIDNHEASMKTNQPDTRKDADSSNSNEVTEVEVVTEVQGNINNSNPNTSTSSSRKTIGEDETWKGQSQRGFKKNGNKPPESTPVGRTESPSHLNTTDTQSGSKEQEVRKARYCHYFVNFGKCSFEDKTGKKCKFIHETAPMCKEGTRCSRNKCMFTHPKPGNAVGFLSQLPHHMMNPWAMISPWLTQPQNHLQIQSQFQPQDQFQQTNQ